ncbi:hypothetical protein [Cryobacterium sp. GrIS_2_6]|uniref:hypothetical protein n=1 Tax=Cryobacterium sp. GrIS_2_6 TaxID=3162785 RepID=UPI002DFF8173|nr:hypothetical protein [Cryobacterium psychrotolerans]MEC5149242.1 hypothetical protein [Cryobacterium psychrotolerans]MEC5149320.1 hypothetical protein [Cryobacterium psychrotolerans]
MTRDDAVDDLKALASYDFEADRAQRIEAARSSGVTWREIAAILGMTDNGVHKAYKKWLATKEQPQPM